MLFLIHMPLHYLHQIECKMKEKGTQVVGVIYGGCNYMTIVLQGMNKKSFEGKEHLHKNRLA